jgi:DHA2 family multidrug resistance protein
MTATSATADPQQGAGASNRAAVTVSIMLATVMQSLDTTIANVALPHMQGSVSASQDQITWVLTSYIVASAIATPLTGWLSDRIGRKLLFLIAIAGFTVASMLCGMAENLAEIVLFRLFQGLFGAFLIPLSQAVLLDIYPPKMHGQAMAIWGAGAILGPILGPFLGGLLTEQLTWRWVFYINLPVGILAFLGVWTFITHDVKRAAKRFDFLGFGTLALFIAAFQLMLDRGPTLDWFGSGEIVGWLVLAVAALWIFLVHTTTTDHPFFDRGLLRDRNFVVCTIFGFFVGVLLFSTMAILPPMMQGVLGYPVLTSGIVSMPRGVGAFVSMFFVGRLVGRVDIRFLLATGLGLNCIALWQMTQFDLSMTQTPLVTSGLLQGFGTGLIFVPMSALAFATLDPRLRGEGSGVNTLIRSLGMAAGISIVQALQVQNTVTMRASMTEYVRPDNPVFAATAGILNPSSMAGLAALNGELGRQAAMVAYVDGFRLLLWMTLAIFPLLLLMRKPKARMEAPVVHAD